MSLAHSYTAAGSLPVKILQNPGLIDRIRQGAIPPVHVQLNPTNRCNLACSFCSCSERDQTQELDIQRLLPTMLKLKELGCQSVTITGGGEPLLYPHLSLLLRFLNSLNIKVGVVSNGTQFPRLASLHELSWLRISTSDEREMAWSELDSAVHRGNGLAWAFSHVVSEFPNWSRLAQVVRFANNYRFTHVRLVPDLLNVSGATAHLTKARDYLASLSINDARVIYQDRQGYTKGRQKCLISLLKPVIGADGNLYPCCGTQYALEPPDRDYAASMKMGQVEDIEALWQAQEPFDGSRCARCYYDDYNQVLGLLALPLEHREFV